MRLRFIWTLVVLVTLSISTLLVLVAMSNVATAGDVNPSLSVPEYLQNISVTVKAEGAQGSGTLVTRTVGGDTVTFVWTAAHVISDMRTVRRTIDADGKVKVLVEFREPQIVAERYQNGRRVGETTLDCKVIKYSDAEYGEDLAVLMVRLKNAYPLSTSAKFHSDTNYIPAIGVELSHCGSLLGQYGANSYTTGVLSQVGRLLPGKGAEKKVFDQVTAVAFPGSSGGGMYLRENGIYVGMLTRGVMRLQGFNFIVPVRRMHDWATETKIEWALNPDVEMPTLEEIDNISVEEVGILSSSSVPSYGNSPCTDGFGTWINRKVLGKKQVKK